MVGPDGIRLFFKKMQTQSENAVDMFQKDVDDTTAKILNRLMELAKEKNQEEEKEREMAQLRLKAATQEDGSLALPIHPETEKEDMDRNEVFQKLPRTLQEGLLLQDVDVINKGLQELHEQGAVVDELMKECSRVGLIDFEETD